MEKILIFGANGFVGRNVSSELKKDYEVFEATRSEPENDHQVQVDLLAEASIRLAMQQTQPDVVINCAGIISAGPEVEQNVDFTRNILNQAVEIDSIKKVIISGSAGEYGLLESEAELPVSENTPLRAQAGYGLAKVKEEQVALSYKDQIDVVVMRIFNPIGKRMADRFLLTNLLKQIEEYRNGTREALEVSRLDAKRDYIAIEDVARAMRLVAEGNPKENVYNVGSGVATSNAELIDLLVSASSLESKPPVNETSPTPESFVSNQADI